MNLMGTGLQEAADMVEKGMEKYQVLLECAAMRKDFPDRRQTEVTPISVNLVPERSEKSLQRSKN